MKRPLLKAFAIAALALSAAVSVYAQRPKVKDNFDQKVRRITLSYKKATSIDWIPAVDNYWVPANAKYLLFEIELYRTAPSIRARLELRQLCQLSINPDIEITREQEFFASNSLLAGTLLPGPSKIFGLVITVDPPDGGTSHAQPHCFQNPDHLGEGPYEASLWLGSGAESSILGDNDTVHLTYTKAFETTSAVSFDRLQRTRKLFETNRGGRRRNR